MMSVKMTLECLSLISKTDGRRMQNKNFILSIVVNPCVTSFTVGCFYEFAHEVTCRLCEWEAVLVL